MILPIVSPQPGTVDLLVVTRDVWSLRFNTNFEFQQNTLSLLADVAVGEQPLRLAEVLVVRASRSTRASTAIGPTYFDPNIARHAPARCTRRRIAYYSRDTGHYEGNAETVSLRYPLYLAGQPVGRGPRRRCTRTRSCAASRATRLRLVDRSRRHRPTRRPCRTSTAAEITTVDAQRRRARSAARSSSASPSATASTGAARCAARRLPGDARDGAARSSRSRRRPRSSARSRTCATRCSRRATAIYRDLDTFDLRENRLLGPRCRCERRLRRRPSWAPTFRAVPLVLAAGWAIAPRGGLASASALRRRPGCATDAAIDQRLQRGVYFASPMLGRRCCASCVGAGRSTRCAADTQRHAVLAGRRHGPARLRDRRVPGDHRWCVGHVELRTAPLGDLLAAVRRRCCSTTSATPRRRSARSACMHDVGLGPALADPAAQLVGDPRRLGGRRCRGTRHPRRLPRPGLGRVHADVLVSFARPMELSVIVPCFNEEANVPELSRRVRRLRGGRHRRRAGPRRRRLHRRHAGPPSRRSTGAHPVRQVAGATPRTAASPPAGRPAWRRRAAGSSRIHRRRPAVPARGHPAPPPRARRAQRRHRAGLAQRRRARQGTALLLSRGLNAHAQRARSAWTLKDNKSGFVMCAARGLRGPALLPRQLLLLAVVHHGGGARQGLLVQADRDALRERAAQGKSFLDGRAAARPSAEASSTSARRAWSTASRAAVAVDAARQFLDREPAAGARRAASRSSRRLRWRGLPARRSTQTHWMMTKRRRALLRDAAQDAVAAAATRCASCRTRSCAAWCATPTATCPTTATRMQEHELRARGHPRPGRPAQAAVPDEGRRAQAPLLRHHEREPRQGARSSRSRPSGSTGEPFVCFVDRAQLEFRWAATLRAQEWTGYRFGDPAACGCGTRRSACRKTQVARELADALLSQPHVHPRLRDVRRQRCADGRGRSTTSEPVLLDGYAEALDFLARYLKSTAAIDVAPEGASCRARRRCPTRSRKLIEEAFGCKVFDKYGAREFSGIAYECEAHAGHHVVAEGYIVEVLQRRAAGGAGRDRRGGDHRPQQLLPAVHPLSHRRSGRGASTRRAVRVRPRAAAHRATSRGACSRSSWGRTGGTCRAPSSRSTQGATTTRSGSSRSCRTSADAITFSVVKGEALLATTMLDEVLATFHQYLGEDMQIDVEFVDNVEHGAHRQAAGDACRSSGRLSARRDGAGIPGSADVPSGALLVGARGPPVDWRGPRGTAPRPRARTSCGRPSAAAADRRPRGPGPAPASTTSARGASAASPGSPSRRQAVRREAVAQQREREIEDRVVELTSG